MCGDGKLYVLQCDDGNTFDGDGCSSSCTLESGWNCTGGTSTHRSVCQLATNIKFELVKSAKVVGRNQILLYFVFSMPIRLTSSNFQITIGNGSATVSASVTATATNLTNYKLAIDYSSSIQSFKIGIVVSLFSRRLLEQRLLQAIYSNLTFDFSVNTYPPAYYYPTQTIDLFDLFSKVIKALAITSLLLAMGCYIGKGRIVYYSVEAANLLVLVYISQGFGLDSFIDWLGYTITNMKECTLIAGFALNDCRCPV